MFYLSGLFLCSSAFWWAAIAFLVLRLMLKNISKLPTTATVIIVRMKLGGVLVVLFGSWGFDV